MLSRLSADTPPSDPPPFVPPSPLAPSHAHRASISSLKPASEAAGAESDGEEDPAAGYVQLDATNFSSGGPEIVDLSKEEDPEEAESGEKVRERRRRRKFLEVLGSENVDLSEFAHLRGQFRMLTLLLNSRASGTRLGWNSERATADGMAATSGAFRPSGTRRLR